MHWAFGPIARMMTMSIYDSMKPYTISGRNSASKISVEVKLTAEAISDLEFWRDCFEKFDAFKELWPAKKSYITFFTDAAGKNLNNFGAWAGWTKINGKFRIARGTSRQISTRSPPHL